MEGKMHKQIVCRSTLLRLEYSHSTAAAPQPTKSRRNKSTMVWKTNCNDSAFIAPDCFFFLHSILLSLLSVRFLVSTSVWLFHEAAKGSLTWLMIVVFIGDFNFSQFYWVFLLHGKFDFRVCARVRRRRVRESMPFLKNEVISCDDGNLIESSFIRLS